MGLEVATEPMVHPVAAQAGPATDGQPEAGSAALKTETASLSPGEAGTIITIRKPT